MTVPDRAYGERQTRTPSVPPTTDRAYAETPDPHTQRSTAFGQDIRNHW
ncbi:hypothetical protein FB389_1568 [Rarobacter incanus]|uniref:Uncharacterized protein n=1 Tax=Rarobacter incanus TaxID=153494 RepID=A0A542SQJ4_9MICO|nr:hypothetical protein FB389_1568 [Rarobacter incanus]